MHVTQSLPDFNVSNSPAQEQSSAAQVWSAEHIQQISEQTEIVFRDAGFAHSTTWLRLVFVSKERIDADFDAPRTISQLAEEQRLFLSTIKDELEDIDLPDL